MSSDPQEEHPVNGNAQSPPASGLWAATIKAGGLYDPAKQQPADEPPGEESDSD